MTIKTLLNSTVMAGLAFGAWAGAADAQTPPPAFTVTSPKHQDGAVLDKRFGGPTSPQMNCGGENVSLPLAWTNVPANTKSFAIVVYDFEGARGPGVVHWIAYGIAPDAKGFDEGDGSTESSKFVGGTNARQQPVYFGPCAPAGDPHHYIYSVYALDVPKEELAAGLTRDQFLDKVKGRVLGLNSIIAKYNRP
jgi:Raf kinase inhibitor-like YbhB/YbcL family protein